MDIDRWAHVARIYDSACDVSPADRDALLDQACGGDAELRRDVEALLAQDVSRDGVIERVADAASSPSVPTTIGRYRLLRLIGEGGMGAVYEAEQDHPRRTVAIKVIKSPLAAPALLRRFAQEATALARLQHPGIARIYDAGTAEGAWGTPFIVMELIRGVQLIDHANQHRLGTRERVALAIECCDAVEHAHQRGIVHRDLKPSNILVEADGRPKVLDFGVAHICGEPGSAMRQTKMGDVVGTIAYMSPEQLLGDASRVDARSDVYSLGVVVFELLAGQLPHRATTSLADAIGAARDEDAVRLGALDRTLRGDLDTILAKALDKDPARRYASAGALADDLRRYLADQPIAAVPATAPYRARKFVRRHRTLVAAAATVFAVLVAGIAVTMREAITATRARDRAQRAEQIATAVNDFLQNDVLAQASAANQSDASREPDPNLTVRTALDRAAARIDGKFNSQPLVEASIRRTIAKAYIDLSLYAEAQRQLERVVDLRNRALGPEDLDTLTAMDELATSYSFQTKYSQSEPLLRKAFDAATRTLGPEHPTRLSIMNDLALLISAKGDYEESATLLGQLLAIQRKLKGDEDGDTLVIMNNLASQYDNLGRFPDSEALRTRVVDIARRVRGPNHPATLTEINNLGVLYRKEGKYADAERMLKMALDGRRRIFGDTHHAVLVSLNSLSLLYQAQDRYAEAEPLVVQALGAARKTIGPEHADTLRYLNNLADLYRKEGKMAEAEAAFVELVEARRRLLGPDHPNTAKAMASLGEIRLARHAYADAEKPLREALHAREKKTPDSWERYYAESLLGESLEGQGRTVEAKPLLDSGYLGVQARAATIPAESRWVVEQSRIWAANSPR